MKSIIYLLLLTVVFSARLKNIKNVTNHFNMKDEKVTITRNENLKHYIENPNVYGIDLFFVKDGVDSKVKNLNTQKDEEGIDTSVFEGTNSCHPIERFLNIKQAIKIVLFNETTTRFFTDMSKEVNGTNKFIYLVEENYKVHQVALHYKFDRIHQALLSGSSLVDVSTYIKTYMKKKDPFFKLKNGMSKFIKNSDQSDHLVLITQYGAAIIRIKENKIVDFIPMKKRNRISNILFLKDRLYVAVGSEGLDVYSFNENGWNVTIEYLKTIDQTSIVDRNEVNILDVKVHTQIQILGSTPTLTETIILLDETNGIYFFKQENNDYNLLFQIKFSRAKAFSLFQDTFMIIAETVNKIEYVAEIFVDVQSQGYYFNRVYIEDTAFLHIEMTHQYAILISEDDHLIMEHGIYNGFTHNNKEFVSSFEEEELVKFIWLQKENMKIMNRNEEVDYYVGLARGEVKIYEVTHKNPALYCTFSQNGVYEYQVKMNSSQCENKFYYNDPYEQCVITKSFKVIVDDSIFDSNNLNALIGTVIGMLALFIIIGALLFICNRRWNLKVFRLQKDLNEKKYLSLGDQDQSLQMKDTLNISSQQL